MASGVVYSVEIPDEELESFVYRSGLHGRGNRARIVADIASAAQRLGHTEMSQELNKLLTPRQDSIPEIEGDALEIMKNMTHQAFHNDILREAGVKGLVDYLEFCVIDQSVLPMALTFDEITGDGPSGLPFGKKAGEPTFTGRSAQGKMHAGGWNSWDFKDAAHSMGQTPDPILADRLQKLAEPLLSSRPDNDERYTGRTPTVEQDAGHQLRRGFGQAVKDYLNPRVPRDEADRRIELAIEHAANRLGPDDPVVPLGRGLKRALAQREADLDVAQNVADGASFSNPEINDPREAAKLGGKYLLEMGAERELSAPGGLLRRIGESLSSGQFDSARNIVKSVLEAGSHTADHSLAAKTVYAMINGEKDSAYNAFNSQRSHWRVVSGSLPWARQAVDASNTVKKILNPSDQKNTFTAEEKSAAVEVLNNDENVRQKLRVQDRFKVRDHFNVEKFINAKAEQLGDKGLVGFFKDKVAERVQNRVDMTTEMAAPEARI